MKDISALQDLNNLECLTIWRNAGFTCLDSLGNLKNLKILDMERCNSLEDFRCEDVKINEAY